MKREEQARILAPNNRGLTEAYHEAGVCPSQHRITRPALHLMLAILDDISAPEVPTDTSSGSGSP